MVPTHALVDALAGLSSDQLATVLVLAGALAATGLAAPVKRALRMLDLQKNSAKGPFPKV